MKSLFSLLVIVAATSVFGAVPSYDKFLGTGGIRVITNPPNGNVTVDGSGVFTSSGTNATVSVSTNTTKISTASTNVNFIEGLNIFLRGTNTASRADVSINVRSNLIFYSTNGYQYMLGTFGDTSVPSKPGTNFGFFDATAQELSFWRNDAGKWIFSGPASMTLLTLRSLGGSGPFLAADPSGDVFRTNSIFNLSTNGTAVSGASTQLVFVAENNFEIKATNSNGKVSFGLGVKSNLTFNAAGAGFMLGSDDNGTFGFYNQTTARWSLFLGEASDDDWIVNGTLSASNLNLSTLSGSGSELAITPLGTVYRTNFGNQGGSPVITNLAGTVANNVTNFISLSTSNATSKPLTNSYSAGVVKVYGLEAGANVTVTPNGSNLVIAASSSAGQGGSTVLTNLDGTVANNVTNVISLSTSNATSKPLTNSYSAGVVKVYGLEGGSGVTATPNGSNIVIAVASGISNFFAMGISNIVSADTAGIVIRTNAGVLSISNSAAAGGSFSVSGNSNQIGYLNTAGNGFRFGSRDKSNPGFGFNGEVNGNIGGLLIGVDKGEDTGLVQIGPPNPASSIATFVPSLSVSNRFDDGGNGVTQEMVRVNYVDVGLGSADHSYIQTWRSWNSGVAPAATVNQFAAGLRKDGLLRLAHGTYYPSNSLANDGVGNVTLPSAAELGKGGFWTGLSNQSLVVVWTFDGTTRSIKVLAP